jgi:hypothetical protein
MVATTSTYTAMYPLLILATLGCIACIITGSLYSAKEEYINQHLPFPQYTGYDDISHTIKAIHGVKPTHGKKCHAGSGKCFCAYHCGYKGQGSDHVIDCSHRMPESACPWGTGPIAPLHC